jgi:transposase
LARTGFFKPVHVKSLPSHAIRALLIARKKLVGQRVTLENQIRRLAVAFGVRLPRGLSSGFAEKGMAASMTRGREQRTAPILSHGQTTSGQFNQAALHPADPIKREHNANHPNQRSRP